MVARRRLLLLLGCMLPPECASIGQPEQGCHRRIYIDAGANWANTLRLYTKLEPRVLKARLAALNSTCAYEWEVYAFEASPVMNPYNDQFVKFLNGEGPRPTLTVPPVGGSIQMLHYAKHFGCPSQHNKRQYLQMYDCMNAIFNPAYAALKVDRALSSPALVQRRLDEADVPNSGSYTRFTFVPAAVGAMNSTLDMCWPYGMMLSVNLRNLSAGVPAPDGMPKCMGVPIIDFVGWMAKSFSKSDLVIVKMDVEGAEHAIVQRMGSESLLERIDVLGFECHERPGQSCSRLQSMIRQHGVRIVSEQSSSGLMGVDPYSTPGLLMPVNPRNASWYWHGRATF